MRNQTNESMSTFDGKSEIIKTWVNPASTWNFYLNAATSIEHVVTQSYSKDPMDLHSFELSQNKIFWTHLQVVEDTKKRDPQRDGCY